MKTSTILFILLLSIVPTTVDTYAQRVINDSTKIGGNIRHFKMFLPDGLPEDAPLVFVLHGYGGNGDINTWMNNAAERHKFALCVPLGLKDPTKHRCWNVGYPFQEGWKVNDVEVMCKMARFVQKKYHLSKKNTFLTGMSNGGEMCYLLAYSKQNTFKALGSLAGLTLVWMYETLEAPKAIPFLEIHGTEDRTSEWWGDLTNKGGWGAYLSVPLAINYLVAKNRCSQIETDTIPGKSFAKNGHRVIHHRYSNPKTHNDVWLYEVVGATHCWCTEDLDTGEEIWKFFSRYLE